MSNNKRSGRVPSCSPTVRSNIDGARFRTAFGDYKRLSVILKLPILKVVKRPRTAGAFDERWHVPVAELARIPTLRGPRVAIDLCDYQAAALQPAISPRSG